MSWWLRDITRDDCFCYVGGFDGGHPSYHHSIKELNVNSCAVYLT